MDTHDGHGRNHEGEAPRDEDGVVEVRTYRFRIDKREHESPLPDLTGRDLLVIAGKEHPDRWKIFQRVDGQLRRVGLDEVVHVSDAGEERFVTLPLDQHEGEQALPLRRDFELPEDDRATLDATGHRWETAQEANVGRVVLRDYPIREGYVPRHSDLMLRLPTGYPTIQIDMFYFSPPLARADGVPIRALVGDAFEGKSWQGWSRHRTAANPWRPDVDDVGTHLQLVEHCLAQEVGVA